MSNELTKAQRDHLRRLIESPDGTARITGGPMAMGARWTWSRTCVNTLRKRRLVTTSDGSHGVAPTVTITAAGRAAMES